MRLLSVLLAMCCASVALAACGGGGGDRLPEEEYFERVEELVNGAGPQISLSSEGIDVFDLEEGRPQLAARYQSVADRTDALADDLGNINPPAQIESLHAEFVDAVNALSETISTLAEGTADIPGGPSGDVFDAVTSAYDAVLDVSSALESVAGERGIAIDLRWAGESAGSEAIDIAPGITGQFAETPPLPDGLAAMSRYIEFQVEGESTQVEIGLPLEEAVGDASELAFYSYEDGEWVRVDVDLEVVSGGDDGAEVAQGDFDSVPVSLAVLREE